MKKYLLAAASLTCSVFAVAQCYTVTPAVYVPDTTFHSVGNIATVMDDHWSAKIPMGFTFCFYGNQYDTAIVGDNGLVSFQIQWALSYCLWPINAALPNTSMVSAENAIGLPYQDLYIQPNSPHHIYTWTSGSAPNRTFTVLYDSIPMYSCSTKYFSGRVILYETSNNIEMQIANKDTCTGWNGAYAIMGIENQSGTMATTVTGRNYPNQWTATQDAWLFTPSCNVCSPLGITESHQEGLSIFPNPAEKATPITFQVNTPGAVRYDIVDLSGRVIEQGNVQSQQTQFTLEESGLYIVRLYNESGEQLSASKLIVK